MLYPVSEPFEGCILVCWTEKPRFDYLFIRAWTLGSCHLLVPVSDAAVNVRRSCSVWVRLHGVQVYEGAYFLVKRSQCPERKSKKLSGPWSQGSQMCFPSGVSLGADSLTHFSADRPTPHPGGLPLLPQRTAHADWFPELDIITDSPPVWTSLPHTLPPRTLPPHVLQLGAHKERSPGTAHPAFTDAQLGSQRSPGRAAWMLSTHGAFQSSPAPRGRLGMPRDTSGGRDGGQHLRPAARCQGCC